MCIVIDMDVFTCVFNPKNAKHAEYRPVYKWVTEGKGFLVLGGTQYLDELRAMTRYYAVMIELKKMGRVVGVRDELVDEQQRQVEALLKGSKCNDCHLIAIIRVSGCHLICSDDKRADKYFKDERYYLDGQKPPSIYRKKEH